MKYQLIKPINPEYTALEQILTNRGIPYEDIFNYINTTDDDINSFLSFGEEKLRKALICILTAVYREEKVLVVVDCDVDGYTSAALLINYLYDSFPGWTKCNLEWIHHEKKQHGLEDLYKEIVEKNRYSLVICPDSSSFDGKYHKILSDVGIKVICLDHHPEGKEMKESDYAVVINNQLCDYPNKQLSGVGVVWQFCKYADSLWMTDYADKYLDLVALGLTADMQSLLSIETKHLINKGFKPQNIHNPFIFNMWQKNKFKLGEHITSWGAALYIAPFVNAMTRSGTQEEKEIVFDSMLNLKAFDLVSSTKRGHKGEEETIVEQAIRVCTNVKNRQSKKVDELMELLEKRIEDDEMMKHKVLLFLIGENSADRGIIGLCANKIMAKYQRPCCILMKMGNSYQGSARGCNKVGITDFKKVCEDTQCINKIAG